MNGIKFVGDALAPSGYGNALRDLAKIFVQLKLPFFFDHIKHDKNDAKLDEFWKPRMSDFMKPCAYDTVINSTTPEYYKIEEGKKNIGWTFWETDRLPDFDYKGQADHNWVKQMNRLDEFWAPTGFVKDVAIRSGVTCPIRIVPWPCAGKYLTEGTKIKLFRNEHIKDEFVIGSVGQLTERKNFKDFIVALCTEFTKDEPVLGLIKTYGADDSQAQVKLVRDCLGSWKRSLNIPDACRFVGVHSLLTEEDMLSLFNRIDCYVCTSRGEGMSGPLIHAMAMGKPVISSAFSAMSDFIDEDSAFHVLRHTLEPVSGMPHIPWYGYRQQWARLDVGELRKAMRNAYEAWKDNHEAYVDCGRRSSAKVRSLYTDKAVGSILKQIVS